MGTGDLGNTLSVPEHPLAEYRRKRDPVRTPEPVPAATAGTRKTRTRKTKTAAPIFVVQEHHASSLHWDFRLERDGVLASWALPKGVPLTPSENHLAVHVEDHPLEYGSFSGEIPSGEYGGGTVSIWDRGTYECEKWRKDEVIVVLHGERVEGRYVLFATNGKNWMIHRMDPSAEGFEPLPKSLSPMLAVPADELPDAPGDWAFEFKWDGIRVLVWIDGGRPHAVSRNGNDLTVSFPELRELAAALGSDQMVLDGEIVVLGEDGRPSFSRLQRRMHVEKARDAARAAVRDPASFIAFDLLHLNGRPLLGLAYDQRRAELERLGISGPSWGVTPSFTEEAGDAVLATAVELGMEGVVAKRRSSVYRPGVRSPDWVKVKHQRTQEVVIGGWADGQGDRADTFGALLLGIPAEGAQRSLAYVGKVGTGFSHGDRTALLGKLAKIGRATSPFSEPLSASERKGAHWVRPTTVGEVRFTEWTPDGRLRHPVWRGLRTDKSAKEVRRE